MKKWLQENIDWSDVALIELVYGRLCVEAIQLKHALATIPPVQSFLHLLMLHETIHWSQGAFVEGRQILEVVLVGSEVVDKKCFGKSGVPFMIDFENAYDHVNWNVLAHALEKKGFSPKWRLWIWGCLSFVSFAILVNWCTKGWASMSKGLRQDDSFPHFLLIIAADVLSKMVVRAEDKGFLQGFLVGKYKAMVSLL